MEFHNQQETELLVGHANGSVTLWDVRPGPPCIVSAHCCLTSVARGGGRIRSPDGRRVGALRQPSMLAASVVHAFCVLAWVDGGCSTI